MKTELSNGDLSFSAEKEDLVKRLIETLDEGNNKLDKPEKRRENVSIDIIKEHFANMFKAQEETIIKIVSSCNTDTITRLDRLPEKIKDNSERSKKVSKETEDLNLSLDASQ